MDELNLLTQPVYVLYGCASIAKSFRKERYCGNAPAAMEVSYQCEDFSRSDDDTSVAAKTLPQYLFLREDFANRVYRHLP